MSLQALKRDMPTLPARAFARIPPPFARQANPHSTDDISYFPVPIFSKTTGKANIPA